MVDPMYYVDHVFHILAIYPVLAGYMLQLYVEYRINKRSRGKVDMPYDDHATAKQQRKKVKQPEDDARSYEASVVRPEYGGNRGNKKQQAQYTGVVGKMQYYVHRYAGLAILCQAVRAIDPAPVWGVLPAVFNNWVEHTATACIISGMGAIGIITMQAGFMAINIRNTIPRPVRYGVYMVCTSHWIVAQVCILLNVWTSDKFWTFGFYLLQCDISMAGLWLCLLLGTMLLRRAYIKLESDFNRTYDEARAPPKRTQTEAAPPSPLTSPPSLSLITDDEKASALAGANSPSSGGGAETAPLVPPFSPPSGTALSRTPTTMSANKQPTQKKRKVLPGPQRELLHRTERAIRRLWQILFLSGSVVVVALVVQTWELVLTLQNRNYGRNHVNPDHWTVHPTRYSWMETAGCAVGLWYSWIPLEYGGLFWLSRQSWYQSLTVFMCRCPHTRRAVRRVCHLFGLAWLFFPHDYDSEGHVIEREGSVNSESSDQPSVLSSAPRGPTMQRAITTSPYSVQDPMSMSSMPVASRTQSDEPLRSADAHASDDAVRVDVELREHKAQPLRSQHQQQHDEDLYAKAPDYYPDDGPVAVTASSDDIRNISDDS